MADICPKADPSSGQAEGESFYRQSGGEGYMQKHYSHLQLVISGITGIILVILGTVNVQFQGALVPISLRSILITGSSSLGYSLVIM